MVILKTQKTQWVIVGYFKNPKKPIVRVIVIVRVRVRVIVILIMIVIEQLLLIIVGENNSTCNGSINVMSQRKNNMNSVSR